MLPRPVESGIDGLLADLQQAPAFSLAEFDEAFLRSGSRGGLGGSPLPALPTFSGSDAGDLGPARPSHFGLHSGMLAPSPLPVGTSAAANTDCAHPPPLAKGRSSSMGSGESEQDPKQTKRQRRDQKNRDAQRRYRHRQKEKMADYERQVEELSARVAGLLREKTSLESRNSLLERVVQLKEEQGALKTVSSSGDARCSPQAFAMCRAMADFSNELNAAQDRAAPPATPEDAMRYTHTEIVSFYRDYVDALMKLMLQPHEDPACPVRQRLHQLIWSFRNVVLHLATQDARKMSQVTCELKRTPPTLPVMQKMLAAMALTKEQKARLLDARAQLFRQMQALLQQRRAILAALEESLPQSALPAGSASHHTAFSLALNASEELKSSLEAEHKAYGAFVCAFYADDLLTPLQDARCVIEAAPALVDVVALVNLVAEQEGAVGAGQDAVFFTQLSELAEGRGARQVLPPDSAFRMLSPLPALPPQQPPSQQQQQQQQQQQPAPRSPSESDCDFEAAVADISDVPGPCNGRVPF